ncbi:MAG: phosphoribosyl-AMP cyclohydrolase [Tepidamorphaceae bacterium]|nr:phosphoribosyl-AMP cyclohydrolase [Rhodobiaceae bacterium]MCC0048878.1 phosphoribosyl-AMP cyclohydrolase [Rhodobiaceae bacterium]
MTIEFESLSDPKLRESGDVLAPAFNADGLVTCVVTDADDGSVLMLAHMNAEALSLTLETGIAHFWSRSRKSLWKKGETSGNEISVIDIRTDCDQDAIWIAGRIAGNGVACHTGEKSCFFRRITSNGNGGFHLKPTD